MDIKKESCDHSSNIFVPSNENKYVVRKKYEKDYEKNYDYDYDYEKENDLKYRFSNNSKFFGKKYSPYRDKHASNYSEFRKEFKYTKKYGNCKNCGKKGHNYNKCRDPTTSLGIISFRIKGNKKKIDFNKILEENYWSPGDDKINLNKVNLIHETRKDIKIEFLLVQRKHSLGFIEFIRGHYNLSDLYSITMLFQQMSVEETSLIKKNRNNFENLWLYLWKDNGKLTKKSSTVKEEYKKSEEMFNILNTRECNLEEYVINLDYILENIKPKWDDCEWGFPKGRRNLNESDLEAAEREFAEETNYTRKNFEIIRGIEPMTEIFNGTNGVKYKHSYFIAQQNDVIDDAIIKEGNSFQEKEIGNLKWFSYLDALSTIRPYHEDKKNILHSIYLFIHNIILEEELF